MKKGFGMAKTTHCPFTHSLCAECALYRGRHHRISFSKQRQGDTHGPKEHNPPAVLPHSVDFQALRKAAEPWAGERILTKGEPNIRLRVIDMESEAVRICEFNEVKTWDWSNPEIMRVIDDRQVTSLDNLTEILCYKAEKGFREIDLYEAPRFILLSGG